MVRAEELLGQVSRKVVELEKALDVRLLERSTRSVRLTEIGESYLRRCQGAWTSLRQPISRSRIGSIQGSCGCPYRPASRTASSSQLSRNSSAATRRRKIADANGEINTVSD